MMLELKGFKGLTEIEFTHAVLAAISEVFTLQEKKYVGKTRLMNLVAFTADNLDFPLTRGWYMYGYFAPLPNQWISRLFEVYQTFERFPDLQPMCGDTLWDAIKNTVLSLKSYFIKDQNDFDEWVHQKMAPHPYRAYYMYETLFYNALDHIQGAVSNKEFILSDFNKIVTNLEHSLAYVENTKALELFFDYVSFWELLILRIQKRGITPQMEPYITYLIALYDELLRPALTPYEKTLQGMNAEQEKEIFKRRVKADLNRFKEELEFLEDMARSFSLLATFEEIRDELGQRTAAWDEGKKRDFKTILEELMGGSSWQR